MKYTKEKLLNMLVEARDYCVANSCSLYYCHDNYFKPSDREIHAHYLINVNKNEYDAYHPENIDWYNDAIIKVMKDDREEYGE